MKLYTLIDGHQWKCSGKGGGGAGGCSNGLKSFGNLKRIRKWWGQDCFSAKCM